MGKAKKNKKKAEVKRRQMIEEVFKRGKKQREIAKKFDDKIAQRQGSGRKEKKFQEMKQAKKMEKSSIRDHVVALDKKLNEIRANRKAGMTTL